jgi:hypothetical protein
MEQQLAVEMQDAPHLIPLDKIYSILFTYNLGWLGLVPFFLAMNLLYSKCIQ